MATQADHPIKLLTEQEVYDYGVTKDPKADGYCATCWRPVRKAGRRLEHRAPVTTRSDR